MFSPKWNDLGRSVWSLNYWRVRFKSSDRAQKNTSPWHRIFSFSAYQGGPCLRKNHWNSSSSNQHISSATWVSGTWNHHLSWLSLPGFRPRFRLGQFAKVQHTSGKTSGKTKMACWPKMKVQPPWRLNHHFSLKRVPLTEGGTKVGRDLQSKNISLKKKSFIKKTSAKLFFCPKNIKAFQEERLQKRDTESNPASVQSI